MRAWCRMLEIKKIDAKYISMIKRWKSSRVPWVPVLLKCKFGCSIWCGCNCYKWRRHAHEHVKSMLACPRAWHMMKRMNKYGCLILWESSSGRNCSKWWVHAQSGVGKMHECQRCCSHVQWEEYDKEIGQSVLRMPRMCIKGLGVPTSLHIFT